MHIECKDYREVLKFYDGPRTTFYLDPPYHGVEGKYYEANRGIGFDHQGLRDAVEDLKGAVVISYSAGDAEKLYAGWTKIERRTKVSVGQKKTSTTEILFLKQSRYSRRMDPDIFLNE